MINETACICTTPKLGADDEEPTDPGRVTSVKGCEGEPLKYHDDLVNVDSVNIFY